MWTQTHAHVARCVRGTRMHSHMGSAWTARTDTHARAQQGGDRPRVCLCPERHGTGPVCLCPERHGTGPSADGWGCDHGGTLTVRYGEGLRDEWVMPFSVVPIIHIEGCRRDRPHPSSSTYTLHPLVRSSVSASLLRCTKRYGNQSAVFMCEKLKIKSCKVPPEPNPPDTGAARRTASQDARASKPQQRQGMRAYMWCTLSRQCMPLRGSGGWGACSGS